MDAKSTTQMLENDLTNDFDINLSVLENILCKVHRQGIEPRTR